MIHLVLDAKKSFSKMKITSLSPLMVPLMVVYTTKILFLAATKWDLHVLICKPHEPFDWLETRLQKLQLFPTYWRKLILDDSCWCFDIKTWQIDSIVHAHRQKYDKVRVTLEMPQNLLSPKLKVFGRVLDFIFIRSTHHVCSCLIYILQ